MSDAPASHGPDWWLLAAVAAYVMNYVGWGAYLIWRALHV